MYDEWMETYRCTVSELIRIGVPDAWASVQSLSINTNTAIECSSVRPALILTVTK